MAFSEDVLARFDAYGWHTQRVEDGNDVAAIEAAIEAARADDRPSLIAVRTHIGFGSPNKQDTQKAHGAPLGADEVRLDQGGLRLGPGQDVLRPGRGAGGRSATRSPTGERARGRLGRARLDAYADGVPGPRPPSSAAGSPASCPTAGTRTSRRYETGTEVATRNASQEAIQALAGRACPSCSAAPPTCPSRT